MYNIEIVDDVFDYIFPDEIRTARNDNYLISCKSVKEALEEIDLNLILSDSTIKYIQVQQLFELNIMYYRFRNSDTTKFLLNETLSGTCVIESKISSLENKNLKLIQKLIKNARKQYLCEEHYLRNSI